MAYIKLSNVTPKRLFFVLLLVLLALAAEHIVNLSRNDGAISDTLGYLVQDTRIPRMKINFMLGSSTIKQLESMRFLQCGPWLNRGIGNATISHLRNYIKFTTLSIEPSLIILYAGENDVSNGTSALETVRIYKILVNQLIKKYPTTEIHVVAIKPSPYRSTYWNTFSIVNEQMNMFIMNIERGGNIHFHNYPTWKNIYTSQSFVTDGVHLTDDGYRTFTNGVNTTCKLK